MKDFIEFLFGTEGIPATLAFIFFSLFGMLFVKLVKFNIKKKKHFQQTFTSLKFDRQRWLDDNLLDFVLAFMASFGLFRFWPDALSFIGKFYDVPVFADIMAYGLLVGLVFQYFLHRWMNNVTIEKTIEKLQKQP